jgi:hypothetical protein
MLDLLWAITRFRCPWCRTTWSWFDRFSDNMHERGGWRRWVIVKLWVVTTETVPIWKAGQWWHHKFHHPDLGISTIDDCPECQKIAKEGENR